MGTPRSPVSAVKHGLALLAIFWQGLFMLSEFVGGLDEQWEPLYFAAISLTWLLVISVTWGPLSATRLRDGVYILNIAMLLAWSVVFFIGIPSDGGWQHGASVTNIAVGLIGFLLATRVAILFIALVGIGEFIAILIGSQELNPRPTLGDDLLYGVYAITIGYVAMFARLALLRAAGRAELAQMSVLTEQVQVQAMQSATRQLDDDERRVHATVLNTLTAFARGSRLDEVQIRSRAQESLDVLQDLVPRKYDRSGLDTTSWRSRIDMSLDQARQGGIDVQIIQQMNREPPDRVGAAFAAAVVESVSNVLRHSAATAITVDFGFTKRDGYSIVVRDNGIGLPQPIKPRFGMRHGIQLVMQEVGGTAEVSNGESSGVQVRLLWRKRPSDADVQTATAGILGSFAAPVLGFLWLFAALRLALSLDNYTWALPVFAAFLWYTGLAITLLFLTRRGQLSGPVVLAIVVAAPLIYVAQSAGLQGASASTWAPWSSEAVASLFLVLIGAGQWWVFAPVLVMWLLMQGDVLAEIIAPGFVILVAIAFFARSMRRNFAILHDSVLERIQAESEALSAAQHMEVLRQRFEITRVGNAIGLLRDIADGSVDVHSIDVQNEAAREERLIRSALRLDPQTSVFDRFVGELAQAGYELRRDVEIDIQLGMQGADADELAAFRGIVFVLLGESEPGATSRLTVSEEGEDRIVRFVATTDAETDTVVSTSDAIAVHLIEGETTWLVEWRVADASSHRRRS